MDKKQKILRYTELVFKRESLEKRHMQLPYEDGAEMETLLKELGMEHKEILERAAKNLIEEV